MPASRTKQLITDAARHSLTSITRFCEEEDVRLAICKALAGYAAMIGQPYDVRFFNQQYDAFVADLELLEKQKSCKLPIMPAGTVISKCMRCGFLGKFIDDGETCPQCKLVQ